jgi:gp72
MREPRLRVGELCAGYGGLGLAVEWVMGAETAWLAEIDPAARRVLAAHWPDVPLYGDITAIDWTTVPRVDVLAGGTPCQDLSIAGRRAGMAEGTRSGLWAAMRTAIATLKPAYVIWENVNGCRSATATSALESDPGCVGAGDLAGQPVLRALGRVLGDLAALGFDAEWRSVRAADVGCCHRRDRVFVLAWQGAAADADGVPGELRRCPAAGETTGGWASGAPARHDRASAADAHRTRLAGRRGTTLSRTGECAPWQDDLAPAGGIRPASWSCGACGGLDPDCATCWLDLTVDHGWGDFEDAIRSHEQLLGRTAPPATEPGRRGTPRLNVRFVEWMMCLPDGWVVNIPGLTRTQQLAMLGNGVVPPQAAAALEDMLTHVPSKAIA